MLTTSIASSRCRSSTFIFKRFQSSSKKNLDVNTPNPVLPKMKTNIPSATNNSKSSTSKLHIPSKKLNNNQLPETKAKQGFSSLPKVASTYNYNPKDLLLDSFFNGYRPMTLPITPPKKQLVKPRFPPSLSNSGAFVYFEIDDNMDFMDDAKNDIEPSVSHTIQDIERQTSTRFDHSHKSLKEEDFKKEEYERELYENKLELAKEEDLTNTESPSHFVESKRYRGRRKLQYKRKIEKK